MTEFDVAIVGYGPTGMTLAALLGARGHKVVVLERHEGLYNMPRAACFDDHTMRVFQALGLADEIAQGAVVQPTYEWVNAEGEMLVVLEYPERAPGGWPQLYMMFQPKVEAVLDRHDKSLNNVRILQGVSVNDIENGRDGVTVIGVDAQGDTVRVRAKYAIGTDGGSSFIRRKFFPDFDDYGFQENWLVCDFNLHGPVDGLPEDRQICDPAQPTSILRIGPDHHRFSFMLDKGDRPEDVKTPELVWKRVAKYLTPDAADIVRVANYVFRSLIVGKWRDGRLLIAGDAAHEMPPFLGQGMCSGIRDAHNLAFKLDLILSGHADEALLDTYQEEREPHVRFITEKAIELGRVQTLRDPQKARERDEKMLAARRANQTPEKISLPGLTGGLMADNGGYFPQGDVRLGGETGRFDDIVGHGWVIVAANGDMLRNLDADVLASWKSIEGKNCVIGDGGAKDIDGTYAAWFAQNGCKAALVRPDFYVYGTAKTSDDLNALLKQLDLSLIAANAAASAA